MDNTQITSIIIIIIGICESLKIAGIPARFIPLFSVILGLAGAFLFTGVNFLAASAGIIIGLVTTGGYRLVKTSILNK